MILSARAGAVLAGRYDVPVTQEQVPEPRKVGEWTPEQRSRLLEGLGLAELAALGVALRARVRPLLAGFGLMLGVAAVIVALGYALGALLEFAADATRITVAIQLAFAALVVVVALVGLAVGIVSSVRMRRSHHG